MLYNYLICNHLRMAGLFRVNGVVNLYLAFLEDLMALYNVGKQLDIE